MVSKSKSRRDFLRASATVAAGIGLSTAHQTSSADPIQASFKLPEGAKRLMDQYKLRYPIFKAAPGAELLATAMSDAGCMGSLGITWYTPDGCKAVVQNFVQKRINFYGNFVLHFPQAAVNLDHALDSGLKIAQFAWGVPTDSMIRKIRAYQGRFGVQVGNKEGADRMLQLGADFIICQGFEAGGHVQSYTPLEETLGQVVAVAGKTPVLAAGGITTGADIRRVLDAGASGVLLGTRLVATKEAEFHDVYKQSIVNAKAGDTVFTNCFDGGWDAMHRVIKNKTYSDWVAAGCPAPGTRPGEGDVLGQSGGDAPVLRYSSNPPGNRTTGNVNEMILYAGTGVKDINDLPSVTELIPRLWKEVEA